jgi:arabinogalactan endo-1,4-beta-galactosidase
MQEGLPDTIYACTSATIILTDPEYDILKSKLQRLSFWDKKLENLEIELNKIALDLQR